jgi:hypothetical protein
MNYENRPSAEASKKSLRFFARKLKRHPAFRLWKAPLDVAKHAAPSAWRLATQRWRHLPTVVIVGAQKAGTTQLYSYLATHPRVYVGAKKEVDYFSKQPDRSLEWYRSRFPLRHRVTKHAGHVLEASPSYLPMPSALRLMRAMLPEIHVIVVLRDPVSRAFSHYQHRKTRHLETRTFQQAIDDELRRAAFPPQLGAAVRPDARPMLDYVARGYYALQLELLLRLYPRKRVLVLDSAELFADTNAACQRVFSFLEVEPHEVRTGKIYNRGYYNEKIDPVVAEHLRHHYRTYDELLAQVLGTRFGWMTHDQPLAA